MRSVEDIISLLGGPDMAARRLSIGTEALRKWRQNGAIPSRHWSLILVLTGLGLGDLPGAANPTSGGAAPICGGNALQEIPMSDIPEGATAALVLADGSVFWGRGFGAHG
ncbi:MAG: carbamoyl phosphate synthase small subunit, partial [Rubritepida sp.]|nr:carbamoyl phosphate synthase small subunit [Rubritepida sp.]